MKTLHEFMERMCRFLPCFLEYSAIKAIIRWPRFSLSSYLLVTSMFKSGIRPATVVDVGANTGQFAIAASRIFKAAKIYAFEPIPSCAEKLRVLASDASKIEVYTNAIGDKIDKVDFFVNEYDQASSLLRLNIEGSKHFRNLREKERISVNIITLDHFFKNKTLVKPVLLKIDVQGAEKDVVAGGKDTLEKVEFVLMETAFTPMYIGEPSFTEMIEIMKANDFSFIRPVGFLKSPKNGEILQADILFKKSGA
jgi:FkbM family methyltransferase